MLIEFLQKIIPNKIKGFLKPYHRLFFPNKLYALVWISFFCNYKCSYCPYCGVDDYSKKFPKNTEKCGRDWVAALDKLPSTSFYFAGGEPFVYKDFPYIINNMPAKHSVLGVVTNGSLSMDVYNRINKKIHLNVSFHREYTNEEEFIKKVLELKKRFHVAINIVATPENLDFLVVLADICQRNKLALHVDPFCDYSDEKFQYSPEQIKFLSKYINSDRNIDKKKYLNDKTIKSCSAGRNYYNIMPNGEISVCSNAMDYKYSTLRGCNIGCKYFLGNIFETNIVLNKENILCDYCCINHCDIDFCAIKKIR